MKEVLKNIKLPSQITTNQILVGVLIVSAFLLGSLWTKLGYLEKGGGQKAGPVKQDETPPGPDSYGSAGEVEKLRADDHIKGDKDAQILLIEYSDLECPFCKSFHSTAKQIVDAYSGKVAWVYRHFPLDQIHQKADKEAEAVECADELGGNDGFWKLTDKIYEVTPSNNGLDLATLPDLAVSVGLNKDKFKACLDSGKYAKHVESDFQSGVKAGVQGTPGNILLNQKSGKSKLIPGALPFDQFKQEIDSLLSS